MAVFVASCDESAGKTKRDHFYFGGFVGPESDWSKFFAPAWGERVLAGPPRIPYLHMTEIRSAKWRKEQSLSPLQAEDRIDAAFCLLDQMQTFYPTAVHVDGGFVRDAYREIKITAPNRKPQDFEPDYLCFLIYVLTVLHHVHDNHPESEKVNFVIESNGKITDHIRQFHSNIKSNLERLGHDNLARLVGELIPDGKDRVPLQAADLLCWYTARSKDVRSMSQQDVRRYFQLSRRDGRLYEPPKRLVNELARILVDEKGNG